ncbi:MAG: SPOR domain-containing protein [Bacteroidales bacterium]|jgi:hypothetical protein|nr:SPOR domain-containing protein [Bacteroidales bacterium]
MKRIFVILSLLVLSAAALQAQEVETAPVDSTLLGKSILSVIGSGVKITQSVAVQQAMDTYVRENANKPITGYRIRVYYDNGPQARAKSEAIEKTLQQQFRAAVYRSFESPNYKVTVGDFRTKDEALRIYNALKWTYPTAYIIKETINYPR